MIKKILILIFFCGFFSSMELNAQSAICNYKYRKRITFDPAKVSGASDLTNYPALIKITADADLRTTANSGHVENANGYDIIFTDADGVTPLSFELEYYGSAASAAAGGSVTAWVLLPTISTTYSTYIYMYYGNTAISTNQSSPAVVWSNYYCVYHMQANSLTDAAGNHNLTNNSTTSTTPTQINDGRSNNGTQWLDIANTYPDITTNFSMQGWAMSTNVGTAGQRIVVDDQNNSGGYALSIGDPGTGSVRFFARGTTPVSLDTPNNTIANNTWYHFVAVADITGTRKTIYINGVSVATGTFSGTWGTDNGRAGVAGENASGETANRLNGKIDEVRVAKSALTAGWVATEYNNQSSPSTFYYVSAEPKVWTGGTNTNYNAAANWLNNSTPSSGDDVIINNGSNQPTLQGNEQVGGLWVRSGATLSLGNNSLSVRYDITNCGTLSNNSGTVVCNATSTNIATQYFSGSGTFNLKSLTVNNTHTASPNLTLSKNVTVNGTLTLASGTVYTSATNILALSNTAVSTSGSSTSFVSGPMSKTGNTDFVFPVGKGANRWRRCAVTGITASDTYTAEYFYSAYTSTTPITSPLIDVSKIEYWQVDRAATGNASLTLYWEAANTSGINNCPDLTIARWSGAAWQERQGTAGGTCSGAGSGSVVTNAVLTAFSPFTFGSKSSAVNPLPITLLSFSASPFEDAVLTHWETATETNNDRFEVERTDDGVIFELVGTVKGSGTTSTKRSYVFTDAKPLKGVSYYRLKQVDTDGKESYSAMVSVDRSKKLDYVLYPNPAKGEFALEGSVENAEVVVYNILGKQVEYNVYGRTAGLIQVDCSALPKGVYYVNVKTNTETKINKLVIE